MITSINTENQAKYDILFKKATSALGLSEEAIRTLEQYFSKIEDLMKKDPKFTILPTDEAYFDIDANSRVITVPNDFRKNGLGVNGDQVAEIVYFRIDRYFDFTDLNNTDIFIQWINPNGVSGVSVPWVRDIDSETDKLIFGWPIDREVVDGSGTLQFSVRFVQYATDSATNQKTKDIIYNFNTLTASIGVNPSITILEDDLLLNNQAINEMIKNRVKNTTTFTNSDIEIQPAKFLEDRFDPSLSNVDSLCVIEDLSEDVAKNTVKARAYNPQLLGSLDYFLTASVPEGSNVPKKIEDTSLIYTIKAEKATGKTYVAGIPYCNDKLQDLEISSNMYKDGIIISEDVYEPVCSVVLNKAGYYYFVADIKYTPQDSKGDDLLTQHYYNTYSKGYYVPGPGDVQINTNGITKFIKENGFSDKNVIVTTDNKTELTYTWQKDNSDIAGHTNQERIDYKPTEEGTYQLMVNATRNNSTEKHLSTFNFEVYDQAVVPNLEIADNNNDGKFTVGEKVTCNILNMDNMKNVSYYWYYGNEAHQIQGTSNTCILPTEAKGEIVYCKVTNWNGFEDNTASAVVGTSSYIGGASN